ncbi:O-antigen ligase family protein [uncultured Ferrovibrio sp.]|uniref:O-antigen ligase family protein n=1 Tax=uncultured Ferrovibrio sp. TaxID=1576913 RepID=UPI0034171049
MAAGFLIAFAMIVLQKRTTYLQLAGLAALLLYVRPRALSRLGITLPLLGFALLVITAFDIRISGRLTSEISLSFFLDHLLAIVGIGTDEQGAIADAASGVPLRLHWWTRIYEQLTSDPIALIGGLGYGIPLTDFRDTLGVVTREPHNSVISVVARLGLIGLLSWIWIVMAFFRAGFQVYWISRRRGYDEISRLALLVIAFAILTLVGCVGEDNMEKPFFAIPFYTLWGFILRIAYQLRGEVAGEYPAAAGLRIARSEYP